MTLLALGGCSREVRGPDASRGRDGHRGATTAASPPVAASPGADPPPASEAPGRTPAEPMSVLGADWLERPDREATEQPEKVLDALVLRPGQVVADVGAGTGYFSLRMARRVGPTGRVLATDIQEGMLARLQRRASAEGVTNVTTVLATEGDARLPAGAVDLVLMVDVYHELAHPADTLRQVRQALRPDGRLALVEYRGEDPAVAIKEEHKMTLAQIEREVLPVGFRLDVVHEFLRDQRVVVFRRTP
ncbi:MAG: methyltransferase domain-containing protein [Myxococcales bacterium]|nr:MAG: methyltransferase domain-containing protein [Myxococcales bacterium]